ncbi:MAG: SDR family NAD(P)-dependent oxidoreductase [Ignisphaera sp.]|nr:SDR family NAD(P)-dependent oxidoreductase [Ignisphaera sp.]
MLWIVTGASSGIGLELTKMLCSRGFRVIGVARNRERLEKIKSELGNCFDYVVADLSTVDGIRSVADSVKGFGSIDVLVNNAGFGLYRRVLDHSLEDLVSMTMTNFVAPIALTRELLKYMGKGSSVVMVITAGIHVALKDLPVYGATKIALHYVSKVLRRELSEKGIHLVEVYPGLIRTEFHERAGRKISGGVPPENVAKAIIEAVEKRKKVVYVPRYLALLRILGPYLPLA